MKRVLLPLFFLILCFSCKPTGYIFDEFKEKYKEIFNYDDFPVGTWFWDEFKEIESQYKLTRDESKLLGQWINATFMTGAMNNYFYFYPNKLFISLLSFETYHINDADKMHYHKVIGTWEINNGYVKLTIYAIIIEDDTLEFPNNKGFFLIEQPYSINFIKIDDLDENGFTRKPINNKILSTELLARVTIKKRKNNRSSKDDNLFVRNIYSTDLITSSEKSEKNYGYFKIVSELAKEKVSGLEMATNPELIEKYIFSLWP